MAEPSNVYASGFGENEKVQRNGRREKKNADIQNLTKINGLVCFYARPPKTEVRRLFSKFFTANILFWEYLGVVCFRPRNQRFL
jgi:hypothetical protein